MSALVIEDVEADRLDIGGARWGLDAAEAVLTLRAVISTGDFEQYRLWVPKTCASWPDAPLT